MNDDSVHRHPKRRWLLRLEAVGLVTLAAFLGLTGARIVREGSRQELHAADAIAYDDCDLIGVTGIVSRQRRHRAGKQQRVAVLMLQTFAGERGAPRRSAHQESFSAGIGECPDQVANALESKH